MTSPEAAAFEFIQNAIGQIVAMIATIIAAARWIDKKNQQKVDSSHKCLIEELDDREVRLKAEIQHFKNEVTNVRNEIKNLEINQKQTAAFLEKDLTRLDRMIENLSTKTNTRYESNGGYDYERNRRRKEYESDERKSGIIGSPRGDPKDE